MIAGGVYLADTSVFVLRGLHANVDDRFGTLIAQGRLAACQMSMLETLNTAPSPG